LDAKVLSSWADEAPEVRYPLLGECLSLFKGKPNNDAGSLSIIFVELLQSAPDKTAFLGDFWKHLHPSSWSGSLASIFIQRRDLLKPLQFHADPSIRRWVEDNLPTLEKWIEDARSEDRAEEESFE
jgi:hypothetical protein